MVEIWINAVYNASKGIYFLLLQNNKGLRINAADTAIWKNVVVRRAGLVYNHNNRSLILILQNYNKLAETDFPHSSDRRCRNVS